MGLLQQGRWVDKWYDTDSNGGTFRRQASRFRNWITPSEDSENGNFKAEKGRYHLYVSLACPWAHRTLIYRELKGLQKYIDVTVVDPLMKENGWTLSDPLYGFEYAYQLYLKADVKYEGRVTVPILWDKKNQTVVSNESSEIIRMFNSSFNHLTGNNNDYYPEALQVQIDELNQRIYDTVNNGVYRSGFATTQAAYQEAVLTLFDSLEWLEGILSNNRYLTGNQITEADWRLFTTLIRFDAVYVGHFKCNLKQISQYPNLSGYLRELFQITGVAETVNFEHIKGHYYESHDSINPTGVVPLGPIQDFYLPHDRGQLLIDNCAEAKRHEGAN